MSNATRERHKLTDWQMLAICRLVEDAHTLRGDFDGRSLAALQKQFADSRDLTIVLERAAS